MTQLLRLEVFEHATIPEGPSVLMPEDIEAIRLAAYEEGYRAGWDDGSSQRRSEAEEARQQVAKLIETLSFGYFEARGHLLTGIQPVLNALFSQLVPQTARAAVVPHVVEALMPIVQTAIDTPIRLLVAPGMVTQVQQAIEGMVIPPLTIEEDPALVLSQARIENGAHQVQIDLARVVDEIEAAFADFYNLQHEEVRHA